MFSLYVYLMIVFAATGLEVHSETIQVKTEEGPILGRSCLTSRLNKKYYSFQGIPFAEPPKRFELAVPKKPWKEVINGTYDRPDCVKSEFVDGQIVVTGSEDCLFLNVYTVNLTRKAAVIVWIHGGRSATGNNSDGPDYFLDEDVVVVQIQYRLSIFGFLTTGDLVCPGNFGLKDQVVALQWIKRNIIHFGGDPKNVTIFGESIGAAAVAFHLTSNKSKGLFKGAIMNSGVSLCLWSFARRGVSTAYAIGRQLGKNSTTSDSLVKQLKLVDYKTLQEVAQSQLFKVLAENPLLGIPIGPVIEIPHETAFLSVKSDQMLSTGTFTKVPMLAGFTSNELVSTAADFFAKWNPDDPRQLVPADIISNKNLTQAGLKIKSQFFGNNAVNSSLEALTHFSNVDQLIRPINRFVLDVSRYVSNTYYYMFSYMGRIREVLGFNYTADVDLKNDRNVQDDPKSSTRRISNALNVQQYTVHPSQVKEVQILVAGDDTDFENGVRMLIYYGVQHAEDLAYLFTNNLKYSKPDETMRLKMVRMWSNFCKFGKPTPKPDPLLGNANWLPARTGCVTGPPYLFNIDSKMGPVRNPYQKELDFYDREIYGKFGQGVYDTY